MNDYLADALAEYAELLSRYGVDSLVAHNFYQRHKTLPEFTELAGECRRLERIAHHSRKTPSPFVVGFVAGSVLASLAWFIACWLILCSR